MNQNKNKAIASKDHHRERNLKTPLPHVIKKPKFMAPQPNDNTKML